MWAIFGLYKRQKRRHRFCLHQRQNIGMCFVCMGDKKSRYRCICIRNKKSGIRLGLMRSKNIVNSSFCLKGKNVGIKQNRNRFSLNERQRVDIGLVFTRDKNVGIGLFYMRQKWSHRVGLHEAKVRAYICFAWEAKKVGISLLCLTGKNVGICFFCIRGKNVGFALVCMREGKCEHRFGL